LRKLMLHHIVKYGLTLTDLTTIAGSKTQSVLSANSDRVGVTIDGLGNLHINTGSIVTPDTEAFNGIIQSVDTVMLLV
jgi:uncharacterized surface protein with fasciclin (FAS1) repeats